jgi:hypothetical protein
MVNDLLHGIPSQYVINSGHDSGVDHFIVHGVLSFGKSDSWNRGWQILFEDGTIHTISGDIWKLCELMYGEGELLMGFIRRADVSPN